MEKIYKTHPEINKDFLISNWVNTPRSLREIALEMNVSESLLERRARTYGVTKHRKYSINEERLFDVHDPNVWYLAGLIATDGYTNTNADFIAITMVGDSEKKLLHDICSYFEISAPVAEYHTSNLVKYSLRISAKGIKAFFSENFGITEQNKTFTVDVPSVIISKDCLKAYILGCFDGDGCISHIKEGHPSVRVTTASEKFIRGLMQLIQSYFNVDVYYSIANHKYPTMGVYGKKNVLNLLNEVYSNSGCLKLDRKYEKYQLVKDIV